MSTHACSASSQAPRQLPPSAWVQRWSHLVPAAAPVLDVACGGGRHMRWFFERNHPVTGVDKASEAVQIAAQWGRVLCADIEDQPWPLVGEQFGAVVVTHYLWRPLLPTLVASVAPGGVLIYETFAQGNATVGRPTSPAFLLQPGELLQACQGLRVVAYEDGFEETVVPDTGQGMPRFVQRIVAVHPDAGQPQPQRYRLQAP